MASPTGQDAARRIRQLAALGVKPGRHRRGQDNEADESGDIFAPGCTIRTLPDRLRVDAAGVAAAVNPANAPRGLMRMAALVPDQPLALTVMVNKYFGPMARTLTVSFLETTPANLRDRIIAHMNAWGNCCGVGFRFTTGVGQVRISRAGAGYWSYLGTDVLLIPQDKPTMNLQAFTMATPESEYKRVVRHETGHTLGFPHEHMRKELVDRIEPAKAYPFFKATQGWSKTDVDNQVLTPLDQANIFGTAADQTSIMCYQLPAQIMKDAKPIVGGLDINATDCGFAGMIYPRHAMQRPASAPKALKAKATRPAARSTRMSMRGMAAPAAGFEEHPRDWSKKDDVDVEALVAKLGKVRGPAG